MVCTVIQLYKYEKLLSFYSLTKKVHFSKIGIDVPFKNLI